MSFISNCNRKFGQPNEVFCEQEDMTINKLKENYILHWENQIGINLQEEGKLCTYRKIKRNFTYENYLDDVHIKQHRIALTKLRISAHKLQIEKGRYSRPAVQRSDRICKYLNRALNKNVVEDENSHDWMSTTKRGKINFI